MNTRPTSFSVKTFLETVDGRRCEEATTLIEIMRTISDDQPAMWGPSIIGFGSQHYKYETGREGDMPRLSFSPRKASITIYFAEGFDRYAKQLASLGKHKQSVSCLYINKLTDIDLGILHKMLEQSFALPKNPLAKPTTVDDYIASIPPASRQQFDQLRNIVLKTLPHASEVLSYGIIGYKIDDKRARVYISGWKDHVAVYPVPKSDVLKNEMKPYVKGRGTLWFSLDEPLPNSLLINVVKALVS